MSAVEHPSRTDAAAQAVRPSIVLATLSVPIGVRAERFAIETAVETQAALIIANMLMPSPHSPTRRHAREHATAPDEHDLDAVRETASRATARGVATELLPISSRRPLVALIELIGERGASLVVLGPEAGRTPRWWLWLAARRVRRQAGCLVWTDDSAPDPSAERGTP